MSAARILLADKEPEYCRALARALSNSRQCLEVTSARLESGGNRKIDGKTAFHEYDLILLGGYPEETAEEIGRRARDTGKVILLTDYMVESLMKQSCTEEKHYWRLYKYSSVNEILSGLSFLLGLVSGKKGLLRNSTATSIIGFYSAGGGAGKSTVAVGTSRELSRHHDKRVLYLSFEDMPAAELYFEHHPEGRNIGDYLYYLLEKENDNLCGRPESFTSSDDYGVEAFFASKGRNDLNYLSRDELMRFLKTISDCGRYDYIALEMRSDLAEDTLFLLDQCEKVVLIRNDDPVSELKNRKFLAYIERMEAFKPKDKFLLAVNRTGFREKDWIESGDNCEKKLKRIDIEKDEHSFRFALNHLDIDINRGFGEGIRKIAGEIALKSAGKEYGGCMGNSVP